MSVIFSALQRPRLILAAVGLLSLIGLLAWNSMKRQEDPFAPYRFGDILVPWAGADPGQVERLVLNVLEEEIAQVDNIKEIEGLTRLGFAWLRVEMHQHVYDTDTVWEKIRVATEKAQQKFPAGAGPVQIRDRSMDSTGIVLALTGSDNLLDLLDAARQLRRDLFRISDIARIDLLANPGEQLTIKLDPARAEQFGIRAADLMQQLAERNHTLPGGSLISENRNLVLNPSTEFKSLEELAATPIRIEDDVLIPLSEIADVEMTPAEPSTERLWFNGRPAVALGIVIPDNRLNAVTFGHRVRQLVEELRPDYAPLQIEEMYYQPAWVETRLAELGYSLLIGVLIVALILIVFMGFRLGFVVAVLLPLATFSGLALFAMGGGVLHQMSVAGMVIALGMLVDNAIVVIENIQWHMDRGAERMQAALASVRELAGPLATATGTTIAAFLPLLLAPGTTADFTRGIPVMVILVLLVSYLYAIFVTPVIGVKVLRAKTLRGPGHLERFGRRLGSAVMARPWVVLVVVIGAVTVALSLRGQLKQEFFPDTDRNQLTVDLHFPEGTPLEVTAEKAGILVAEIARFDSVTDVNHFVGTSGPRFYYNLIEAPRSPHLARIVAITQSEPDLPELIQWIRAHAPDMLPDAQVVVRRLGQGPPVVAPVEIRLYSRDPALLERAADQVVSVLRAIPGAEDVRHRMGEGIPTLVFDIDDAEAARHGVSRRMIAETLAGATLGSTVSTWRAGREPFAIRLRTPEGEHLSEAALSGLQVLTESGEMMPLALFVNSRLEFQPALIEHRGLQRMTAVLAETAEGVTYSQILRQFRRQFDTASLPEGVQIEVGGAAKEAGTANTALFQTLPIGLLLLLGFLLWQFNSFRLVAIILVTVPLAAVGVIPGLVMTGQTFGFTAILGVIALIGIVVNNAIVLIDVIESNRRAGAELKEAVISAVTRRIRPILLTTATTVAGLLPLTFTRSTMWPPMAWSIITGLLASTVLTLLVVPILYRVLMSRSDRRTAPLVESMPGKAH